MDKPGKPPSSGADPGDVSPVVAVELPEARTERIAFMRHELAELQRQLTDAQQRIAAELQGRAEDADRFEALEARLESQEVKAREEAARIAELGDQNADLRARVDSAGKTVEGLRRDLEVRDARIEESQAKHRQLAELLESHASSLRDSKSLVAAREADIATKIAELDTERAARARVEQELEASHGKHRELTELLETHASSLRDAKAQLADREAELATRTSERDAHQETTLRLEVDLEKTRRALDSGRARVEELAGKIFSLGQAMIDAAVTGEPHGAEPAPSSAVAAPVEAHVIETTSVAAVEPPQLSAPSRAKGTILVLGGIAVGVAASLAVVELRGSKETAATQPREAAGAAAASSPSAGAVVVDQPTAPATGGSAQPANPTDASAPVAAPPAAAQRNGIIVLPPEADNHRVFVDGRQLQPKDRRVEVPCGSHQVQIGSRSEPRVLDVACDGETELR